LIHPADSNGAPGRLVDLDQRPPQPHLASGHRKLRGQIRHKTLHDWFDGATYDGIHRPAHSSIAKKGGAAGKNLFVCRLDVSVSAEHGRNPSIEKTGERNFFARRFTLSINHDD